MPIKGALTDPALVRGGLGSEAQLLVVQWRLYLFVSLANMAATTQSYVAVTFYPLRRES